MTSKRTNIDTRDKLITRSGLHRRKLLAFLRSDRPAWQDHDHPELAAGTAAWVRKLRRESDCRPKP